MKIVWYGHSCFRVVTGASSILIDPRMKGNPTFERCCIAGGRASRRACGIEMPTSSLPKWKGRSVVPKGGQAVAG